MQECDDSELTRKLSLSPTRPPQLWLNRSRANSDHSLCLPSPDHTVNPLRMMPSPHPPAPTAATSESTHSKPSAAPSKPTAAQINRAVRADAATAAVMLGFSPMSPARASPVTSPHKVACSCFLCPVQFSVLIEMCASGGAKADTPPEQQARGA